MLCVWFQSFYEKKIFSVGWKRFLAILPFRSSALQSRISVLPCIVFLLYFSCLLIFDGGWFLSSQLSFARGRHKTQIRDNHRIWKTTTNGDIPFTVHTHTFQCECHNFIYLGRRELFTKSKLNRIGWVDAVSRRTHDTIPCDVWIYWIWNQQKKSAMWW